MATVTPPLRPIVEPPTPKYGPKHDNHEPYLRRRSSRLKSMRTPSPGGSDQQSKQTLQPQLRKHQSQHLSPPSSPLSPNDSSPRRGIKCSIPAPQMEVADRLILPKHVERMLPTPVKTPSKKETKRATRPASKILFPQGLKNSADEVIPRRNRVSLRSPGVLPEVEIYTDMNARLPELDEAEENVFYDRPSQRSMRGKTRTQELKKNEEKRKQLHQGRDMEKGMWFTFRGKRVWRDFEADDSNEYPPGTNMDGIPYSRKMTPPPKFIKTAYKPRTLFPDAYKKGDTTDEEAVTDIEHPEKHELSINSAVVQKPAATPTKQRFYATPPTTARTTRSTAKRSTEDLTSELDEIPTSLFAIKKGKKTSPFSEWSRVKGESVPSSQEKKRKRQSSSPEHGKRVKNSVSEE